MLLIKPPYFLVCFAEIIDSPFDTIAGIESDVPVPGPEIIPPSANFFTAVGAIIPGLATLNALAATVAREYALLRLLTAPASKLNV